MSKKNSLLSFVNIVNILVEPWTNNRIKEYESLYSQLKTNREKVVVMLLSIFFQIPKISIKSTKILSEKCHISINEVPNSLPQIVYNCLFRLIPFLSVKKDMTYTKVALICASSLPPSQLHFLFEVFLKYPDFHLAQSVYSILFERDPTLSNFFAENFDKCENILPYALSSLSLQPFSNEFILKIASVFLSGKVQTTSSFFYSFCFYINRHIFPIDFETTDYFVLTLFQKIEFFFAPYSHSYLFDLISKTLNDFPLPFISIHLFFQDFDENQIKSIFTTLIKENGSIKSFFVLSQIVSSEKMKELYSICTCTRFCTYTAMKKNIYFFKRSLEKITSLHFELRVLSKILEIASIPEFQDISFEFLDIFKPFTATACTMSDILKIFFTRDKKMISNLISNNVETKASILTALYLLGNSPIAANPKLKTRYKSLTKAIIPRLSLNGLQINCLMPKSLSTTLTKQFLSNEELLNFYYNLTVKQIKPAPFKVENAVNIIGLFQMSRDEIGHNIRENLEVPPNAFESIKPEQINAITQSNSNLNNEENQKEANMLEEEENINSSPKRPDNDSNLKLKSTVQNSSNIKINKTNSKLNETSTRSNLKISKFTKSKPTEHSNSNLKLNKSDKSSSNPKLNKSIKTSTSNNNNKKKTIKKVIGGAVDINLGKKEEENCSIQSELVAVVEPKRKGEIDYQFQSAVIENIEQSPRNFKIESATIDDVSEKVPGLKIESSVIDDVEEKTHKMALESSTIDDLEERQKDMKIESITVDDIKEKVRKLATYSTVVSSIDPSLTKEEKKRANCQFQSKTVFDFQPLFNGIERKPLKFVIQSSTIASRKPTIAETKMEQVKLGFQSSEIIYIKPIVKQNDQKTFNFSIQNTIISSLEPIQTNIEKEPLKVVPTQSISRANQIQNIQTVSNTIFSIEPIEKTPSQNELEKIQKIPISKYNISTQINLIIAHKKNELILSENSITTEKVLQSKINKIGICYNSNNNFESNLLSDDNLSSSELLDKVNLDKKSSSQINQNSNKLKNQIQLKNSEKKNQKSLKNSEVKNSNQIKISNKNQIQKKNTVHNDLTKSHSFSLTKSKQVSNEEKPTKQKSQPNIPKPPSDAKKNNQNIVKNKKLNDKNSDDIPPIPRPKSMNNIAAENEDNLDISSDDIGIALPSDDYEFSDSKSSSSLSGLSDLDDNEINQMFGDDEQVQMFADMLLPPDK